MTSDIATVPESESATSVAFFGAQGTREFVRYFLASGVALAVDVGALALFTDVFGVHYLASGALAFTLGLIVIYILSIFWVFEHRTLRSLRVEFALFALIGVIGLLINESMLALLTGYFALHYLFSKAVSVIVVFSWNFGARKYVLFRATRHHESHE